MQDSDNILLGDAIALTPIISRSIDLTTRVLHALVIYPRGLLQGVQMLLYLNTKRFPLTDTDTAMFRDRKLERKNSF